LFIERLIRIREGDLRFEDYGAVTLIRPLSEAGADWIMECRIEQWRRIGYCGHCALLHPEMAARLIARARGAGLDVRLAKRTWYRPFVTARQWATQLQTHNRRARQADGRARRAKLN